MVNAVIVHNVINPKTGLTIKQENLQQTHDIPLDTLVEIDAKYSDTSGCRLYVVAHSRDCDGEPLYNLSFHKSSYFTEYDSLPRDTPEEEAAFKQLMLWKRMSMTGGWGKESLKIIKEP